MEGTKMTAGTDGYVIKDGKIVKVGVRHVEAGQDAGSPESITNTCDDDGTYDDNHIGTSPQEIANLFADGLVKAYNAETEQAEPATTEAPEEKETQDAE